MTDAAAYPGQATRARGSATTRLSLRTRVALNVVTVTALIQLVLGAITYLYFCSTIDQFFNARLRARAQWAAAELTRSPDPISRATLEAAAASSIRLPLFTNLLLAVRDEHGKIIATSHAQADVSRLPAPSLNGEPVQFAKALVPGIGTRDDEKTPARVATVPLVLTSGRRLLLTAAVSNAAPTETIDVIGRAVLMVSLFGLTATGAAAWFVTGLSLKPLSRLHAVADQFNLETIADSTSDHRPEPVPELAQLASELDAARERIRMALQANDRFISNVSHEIKTPIAVLRAQAQTLDATDLPPRTREFVRSVIEETRRLGTMVDSFLTLAAVRSGRALTALKPVYLNDVMLETIAHCASSARQSNVTIVPELYETDEDLTVSGDPDLLRVLFDNLLRNAVRFSPAGTSVIASVRFDAHSVTVAITDAGPGIPSEILPRLFERFTQSSDEIGRGRGHGLGLSIAQGIAELHGGLITVTNLPQGGCRFTLTLPRLTPGRSVFGHPTGHRTDPPERQSPASAGGEHAALPPAVQHPPHAAHPPPPGTLVQTAASSK